MTLYSAFYVDARVRSSKSRRPAQVNALTAVAASRDIGCHGGGAPRHPVERWLDPAGATDAADVGANQRPYAGGSASVAPTTPTVPAGELTSPVPNGPLVLREAVSSLTRKIAEYGGQLGVAILDVQSGELLAAQNDRRPLNPASNAKLFTAAAALATLHGNYRFETGLYGEQKGRASPGSCCAVRATLRWSPAISGTWSRT